MSNFPPPEVVGRCSETKFQVGLGSSIDLSRFRSTHKVKWRGVFHKVNISYQQIETTQLFEGITVHCMSGNRE